MWFYVKACYVKYVRLSTRTFYSFIVTFSIVECSTLVFNLVTSQEVSQGRCAVDLCRASRLLLAFISQTALLQTNCQKSLLTSASLSEIPNLPTGPNNFSPVMCMRGADG